MIKVWCECSIVGYNSWEEVEADGLLNIEENYEEEEYE